MDIRERETKVETSERSCEEEFWRGIKQRVSEKSGGIPRSSFSCATNIAGKPTEGSGTMTFTSMRESASAN